MTTVDMRIKSRKLYESVMQNRHTRFQTLVTIENNDVVYNTILVDKSTVLDNEKERYTYVQFTHSICEQLLQRYPLATFTVKKYDCNLDPEKTLMKKLSVNDRNDAIESCVYDMNHNFDSIFECVTRAIFDFDLDLSHAETDIFTMRVCDKLNE